MQAYTEEQRKALIEVARKRLGQYQEMNEAQKASVGPRGGIEIDYDVNIALMEIALASLTADPVAMRYRLAPPHMRMPDGSPFYGDWKLVPDAEAANPGANYERVNLYAAPPAPALRLPDGFIDSGKQDYLCDSAYVSGMMAGWNFGVTEDSEGFQSSLEHYRKGMREYRAGLRNKKQEPVTAPQPVKMPSRIANINLRSPLEVEDMWRDKLKSAVRAAGYQVEE